MVVHCGLSSLLCLLDEPGKTFFSVTTWVDIEFTLGVMPKPWPLPLTWCAGVTVWKRHQMHFFKLICMNIIRDLRQMDGVVLEWVWWFTSLPCQLFYRLRQANMLQNLIILSKFIKRGGLCLSVACINQMSDMLLSLYDVITNEISSV